MTYPRRTVKKRTKKVFNKRTYFLPSVCFIGLRNIWKEVLSWSNLMETKHDQLSQTTYQWWQFQEDFRFLYEWKLTASRKNGSCVWGWVRSTQKSSLKLKSSALYKMWIKAITPINIQVTRWWALIICLLTTAFKSSSPLSFFFILFKFTFIFIQDSLFTVPISAEQHTDPVIHMGIFFLSYYGF